MKIFGINDKGKGQSSFSGCLLCLTSGAPASVSPCSLEFPHLEGPILVNEVWGQITCLFSS